MTIDFFFLVVWHQTLMICPDQTMESFIIMYFPPKRKKARKRMAGNTRSDIWRENVNQNQPVYKYKPKFLKVPVGANNQCRTIAAQERLNGKRKKTLRSKPLQPDEKRLRSPRNSSNASFVRFLFTPSAVDLNPRTNQFRGVCYADCQRGANHWIRH